MIIHIPTNKLSTMLKGIHSSIDSYDSPLDEYSFAAAYIVIVRINNNFDNLISLTNSEEFLDYLSATLKDFYNGYPEQFISFKDNFINSLKLDDNNDNELNSFIVGSGTLKPALEISNKAYSDLESNIDKESRYTAIGLILINLFFAVAVRLYQANFKIFIPSLFKFISEYGWIINHSNSSKLSKEYYNELQKNYTPIQRHVAPKKETALSLAEKIWGLDKAKILLRKHVAEIITELLPHYNLSTTQVDNWLKQSYELPSEILERYKNHNYGNSKPEVKERENLKAEILLALSPIYCEVL